MGWLVAGLLGACAQDDPSELTPAAHRQHDAGPALSWQTREVPVTGNVTEPVTLQFDPAVELFTVRASALPDGAAQGRVDARLAFQLEAVQVNESETWVQPARVDDYAEFCSACTQRVSAGAGYGLFGLPSAALVSTAITTVTLRIALRDCTTWLPWADDMPLPAALRLDWNGRRAPTRARPLRLRVAITLASEHGFAEGVRDPLLTDALARLQDVWRAAGIALDLSPTRTIAAPVAVGIAPDRREVLLDLSARAAAEDGQERGSIASLVLTPCLTFDDPLSGSPERLRGRTPHLPGGFGVAGEPDGMFVAVESCGDLHPQPLYLNAPELAAVMAHELGHYLGLYHVQETDRTEDQLLDTTGDQPNLMQRMPASSALQLTDSQIDVARRHPALTTMP